MSVSDFYTDRRELDRWKPEPSLPEPIGWSPEHTATGSIPPHPTGDDPFDSAPSRRPYPDSMPNFGTTHAGLPPADDHLRAMHAAQKVAHEDSVLVEGGELYRLGELQRAILETKALQEELGTGVVSLSPQSERYLAMEWEQGDDEESFA